MKKLLIFIYFSTSLLFLSQTVNAAGPTIIIKPKDIPVGQTERVVVTNLERGKIYYWKESLSNKIVYADCIPSNDGGIIFRDVGPFDKTGTYTLTIETAFTAACPGGVAVAEETFNVVSTNTVSTTGSPTPANSNNSSQSLLSGLGELLQNGDNVPKFSGQTANLGALISGFLNISLYLGAFMAFFWLIWGTFQYILASGKKEELAKARSKITWALIGLVVIFSAFLIAKFAGYIFVGKGLLKGGLPF